MCSKDTLDSLLRETHAELSKFFGDRLENVILYGSYARGEYDAESDIDVMALVNIEKSELVKYRRKVSDFASDMDLKYGVVLSVKLQDKFTFEKYGNALPYYMNIVREGVNIGVQ